MHLNVTTSSRVSAISVLSRIFDLFLKSLEQIDLKLGGRWMLFLVAGISFSNETPTSTVWLDFPGKGTIITSRKESEYDCVSRYNLGHPPGQAPEGLPVSPSQQQRRIVLYWRRANICKYTPTHTDIRPYTISGLVWWIQVVYFDMCLPTIYI